jgi:hypothetical protein
MISLPVHTLFIPKARRQDSVVARRLAMNGTTKAKVKMTTEQAGGVFKKRVMNATERATAHINRRAARALPEKDLQ